MTTLAGDAVGERRKKFVPPAVTDEESIAAFVDVKIIFAHKMVLDIVDGDSSAFRLPQGVEKRGLFQTDTEDDAVGSSGSVGILRAFNGPASQILELGIAGFSGCREYLSTTKDGKAAKDNEVAALEALNTTWCTNLGMMPIE